MSILLSKIWFDLWQDKSRTAQVVLVIALGSIAIGLVIGGRNLIVSNVNTSYEDAEPSFIRLSVSPPLTSDQLERLSRIEGVSEVEGLLEGGVEWRYTDEDEWQTAQFRGRDDYENQIMTPYGLREGVFPGRNTVGIGLISVGSPTLEVGQTVQLRSGDRVGTYEIVGRLDPIGPEPVFGEAIYADSKTFARISGQENYNLIQTRDTVWDPETQALADLRIQEYFEEIGVDSVGVSFPFQDRIVPPDVTPATAILNAIFLLLGVIGVVVVILGIFLVYNSISAIVSQQTSQIGVMKAIGATAGQVAWSYFLLVITYGLLAVVISLPVGAFAALGLQTFFGNFLNIESNPIRVDQTAILMQVAICLIAPLLAALVPLSAGMRITVREAISTYGITGAMGLVNRLVARFTNISYTIILTIGNTFRNQRRVIIIEVALIVAGTIFMMVLGVSDATQFTYDGKLREIHRYDVLFSTSDLTRVDRLEQSAFSVPEVTGVDSWQISSGSARVSSQSEREVTDARVTIYGQPPETEFYNPEMLEGRWLLPSDRNAVVAGSIVAGEENWSVGDEITISNTNDEEIRVTIVGIHFDPATGSSTLHIPLGLMQAEWGEFNSANAVFIRTEAEDAAAVALAVEDAFAASNISLRPSSPLGDTTIDQVSEDRAGGLDIILNLLVIMAIVIALVGGVGLSGVLSLSVLERRREIGVMRAIGASSWQVVRLFIGEGILLGLISWIIAIPLSIPAAWFLATRGLAGVLNTVLAYRPSLYGPLVWLFIIVVLAVIASALPARGAAKISVRESLSYS